MTSTIAKPRLIALTRHERRYVYLLHDGGTPTVVQERLWKIGCHLALAGGWSPEGCVAPWVPADRRVDYWRPEGQQILKGDAKALGAGLLKGLEKYRRQESGVLRLFAHPKVVASPHEAPPVWFNDGGARTVATFDLFELLHRLHGTHPAEMVPGGEVEVMLRELAADLRRGTDVTLSAEPPVGWYPPGTELVLVEVLPAAGVGLRLWGKILPPGTRVEMRAEECATLPPDRVRRLNLDGTPYVPPHSCNCPHCVESKRAGVAA